MNKNEKLVVYPSDTSQWLALVNDAEAGCEQQLDEALESYLVFLLMRFSQRPEISSSILSLDFFASIEEIGKARSNRLRDLGDKSLLLSGLFPGIAESRHVNVDYFVDMGQSAYALLANIEDALSNAELFAALCIEFSSLVNVLQAMRDLSPIDERRINVLGKRVAILDKPGD